MGHVYPDSILPEHEATANVCITGGTQEARNCLILQNCKQSVFNGIPVIIIHEGNYHLEYDVKRLFRVNVIVGRLVNQNLSMNH